jgi:hypothetical protein
MKRDETQRVYSLVGVLGITVLAFLILVSMAGAAVLLQKFSYRALRL